MAADRSQAKRPVMRPEEAEGFVKKRLEELIEQTKPKIGTRRGKKPDTEFNYLG